MRIIFICGFGEDELMFSKIIPFIPGDKVVLNSWHLMGDKPVPEIDALKLATALVQQYCITNKDVVIGHSMGGWIGYYIKHITHCWLIQIASWTNGDKVVLPISNPSLIYWAVKKDLYFNGFVKWLALQLYYKHIPSKEIFSYVYGLLIKGNNHNINNQLRVILTPVTERLTVRPDLRIHSKEDNIIRHPDEPFHPVTGDHFTLYTYPEEVYKPILRFLQSAGLLT